MGQIVYSRLGVVKNETVERCSQTGQVVVVSLVGFFVFSCVWRGNSPDWSRNLHLQQPRVTANTNINIDNEATPIAHNVATRS
jgi:hypothetical protein